MKTIERLVLKYLIKIAYILSSILPIKKRVVFATYRMSTLKDNFKYIYEELSSRNVNYESKFLFKKPEGGVVGKIKYLLHMIKATYYMATSEFFIIDDFYFPVYAVELRKGTEVVQVWHACGAFKKFGYSIIDKEYGADNNYIKYIPIHKNYCHALVSSKKVSKFYAEAFNMSENNIRPIGIPRTDVFFNEQLQLSAKEKLYNQYPKLIDKKVVLYAPTFRGSSQADAKIDISFDLNKVIDSLDDNTILALRMHPFIKNTIDLNGMEKIIDLTNYDDMNDILLITDILITDYSSIIFEYSLLERPIIFYADDKEQYKNERDFYYNYEEMVPGPIVSNVDELIDAMQNSKNFNKIKVIEFKNKFFDYVDGKSSKRFVENIILKNK